jgi:hypothetical protein
MSNRNDGLERHVVETREGNDKAIVAGLSVIEDKKRWSEYKPTVTGLQQAIKDECNIDISLSTIRLREWAKNKLKSIKKARKEPDNSEKKTEEIPELSQLELLKKRVPRLLEQNALLFEENLNLQSVIDRQSKEITILSRKVSQAESNNVFQLDRDK